MKNEIEDFSEFAGLEPVKFDVRTEVMTFVSMLVFCGAFGLLLITIHLI